MATVAPVSCPGRDAVQLERGAQRRVDADAGAAGAGRGLADPPGLRVALRVPHGRRGLVAGPQRVRRRVPPVLRARRPAAVVPSPERRAPEGLPERRREAVLRDEAVLEGEAVRDLEVFEVRVVAWAGKG